jgi:nucleotide-binding universal stress UspA family protein
MLNLDHILLARDFSPISNQAMRHGLDLASRTGATLHLLYAEVLHESPFASSETPSPASDLDEIREQLQQKANGAPLATDPTNVEVREAVVRDVAAAPAILNYADENDIDLITLGTHGRRGVKRLLLGSVAEEVVRHADRPVMTVRGEETEEDRGRPSVDQILVPVDFSKFSRQALQTANELADVYDARIDALHVVEEKLHPAFYVGGVKSIEDIDPDIKSKAQDRLTEFVDATLGPDVETATHVVLGKPARAISSFVENHGIDLVSIATHGQSGVERFLLGSVTEKVVRHVGCPVLTVKSFGRSLVSGTAQEEAAHE